MSEIRQLIKDMQYLDEAFPGMLQHPNPACENEIVDSNMESVLSMDCGDAEADIRMIRFILSAKRVLPTLLEIASEVVGHDEDGHIGFWKDGLFYPMEELEDLYE